MDTRAASGTDEELTQPLGPRGRRGGGGGQLDALLGFERKALARRLHLEDVSHGGSVVCFVLGGGETLCDGGGDAGSRRGHAGNLLGLVGCFLVFDGANRRDSRFAPLATLLPLLLALPEPLSLRRSLRTRGRGCGLVGSLARGDGGGLRGELLRGRLRLGRPQKFASRLHPPPVLVQDGLQLSDARHNRRQFLTLLYELLDNLGRRPLLGVGRHLERAGGFLLGGHAVVEAHRSVNLLGPPVDDLEPPRELVPQRLVHVVGVDILRALAQVLENLQLG